MCMRGRAAAQASSEGPTLNSHRLMECTNTSSCLGSHRIRLWVPTKGKGINR